MKTPENSWKDQIKDELEKPYFKRLCALVDEEYEKFTVFPPPDLIFRALDTVDYDDIKVVILGQDPYHGAGQANGMAFAVNDGIPLPPSLINIYKEIEDDLKVSMPKTGSLIGWAKQGVLLLNATLTVRKATPQSHSQFGWQTFTDEIVKICSRREKPMVFMLWGSGAISKKQFIGTQHLVLTAPHPSPLSAYRGFFGCKHFSKANDFLVKLGEKPIDWSDVDGSTAEYYENSHKIKRV